MVIPDQPLGRDPPAYALPKGESELYIAVMDGFSQLEYDRWVLGRDPAARIRRWSIAKDVLGWIE
ncbi:MAG: hypothetical protein GY856_54715 [bacterium]|nr:hypothetical protein [bacterium]